MILANTSQKPDLDRKAITTLGDSLYNRGDLFGAQFCYLMAQVGFGKYSTVNQETALMFNSNNTIRLILLGSSHHKNFLEFATNDAIIMTEIYEYACTLNDDKFSIAEFQPYKYLLATRMLDYGFYMKTLMYMEQISKHIELDPSKYTNDFINKIFTLGDRLKYHDPGLEKTLDELNNSPYDQGNASVVEDQKWLQNLHTILVNATQYQEQHVDQFAVQQQYNQLSPQEQADQYHQNQLKSQIDQQFAEINQQFNELNMQYASTNNDEQSTNYGYQSVPQQGVPPTSVSNDNNFIQPPISFYDPQQQQPQLQQDNYDQFSMQRRPSQTQPEIPQPQTVEPDSIDYYAQQQQQQQQLQQQPNLMYPGQVDNAPQNQTYDYWNQQQNAEVSRK